MSDFTTSQRCDGSDFEVTGVVQGPPPAAPAQPERLAVGSERVPEPARYLIAGQPKHVYVECLAAQVRAVERAASASLYEALLLLNRTAAAGDDERHSRLARCVDQLDREVATFRRQLWEVV